jgi:hypothetical protein
MRQALLFASLASCAFASVPVYDACSEDAAVVATVQENDPIDVRHGVSGEAKACYAVSVRQGGATISGYVLDSALPAIKEFERRLALESRVPLPPVAESAPVATGQKKPPVPLTGPPFEAWSGVDIKGKRLQIDGSTAKVTLVTFWSAPSAAARRSASSLEITEEQFRAQGVKAFGLVQYMTVGRLGYYLDDMGLNYPIAFDRQGLAAKYNADPSRGTTLVIDASNHIIASSSDPKEIRATVAKLLSSQ